MFDPLTIYFALGSALIVVGSLAVKYYFVAEWYRNQEDTLSFEEVCRAVAGAKVDRRADENLNRDYVDGADAVLAELLERGYGDTPEDMQTAYRAGGDEPDLEVDS